MDRQSGFTLIELMITIAIIAILSAIAIPNGIAWISNGRVNSAARDIVSMLQRAKMEAVRQNAFVVVRFDASGNYRAFIDDGEGTADLANGIPVGSANWVQDGTERTLISGQLPPGVTINGKPFNELGSSPLDGWTNRFNSRAMPSISGNTSLTNSRGHTVIVSLNTGGNIQTQ